MDSDSATRNRRSVRLQAYDYSSAGAYFVTIVTQNRRSLFGSVDAEKMQLNSAGSMVSSVWNILPERFPNIELDAFVVMPNHIHGILMIAPIDNHTVGAPLVGAQVVNARVVTDRATTRVAPTNSNGVTLGAVIGAYKSLTTLEYVRGVKTASWPSFQKNLWQRNYYEHIIRDETSLNSIRQYISDNPVNWAWDKENPDNLCRP